MENQVFIDRWLSIAITDLPNLSKKIIGVGKPYELLLVELLKHDPESTEKSPTDKSLISKFEITSHFFRK